MAIEWKPLDTAPRDGTIVLLKFTNKIIASGRYRKGYSYEPDPMVKQFRCECCGKFGNAQQWAPLD